MITIFIGAYLVIFIHLLKKTSNHFEYDALFTFNHIPFKFFNLASTKGKKIKKTVIKAAVLASLFILIISLIMTAIMGTVVVKRIDGGIETLEKNVLSNIREGAITERYERFITSQGYGSKIGLSFLKNTGGKIEREKQYLFSRMKPMKA
ncbi:MAG: hypothetical protein GXP63_04050 [DPANN group archaeon]|nr:hypothetical protein [DPANN group archaeon]